MQHSRPSVQSSSSRLYAAILILFLAGVGFLFAFGLSRHAMPMLSVAQALDSAERAVPLRVAGVAANIEDRPGGGADFDLLDAGGNSRLLRVVFSGTIPETLKNGAEVFVEGKLAPGNNVFAAVNLVTKCPSRYQTRGRE